MKIYFPTVLATLLAGSLAGQSIDFFNGLTLNQYYSFVKEEGHYQASFVPGSGFSSGIGFRTRFTSLAGAPIRLTLRFQQFDGGFEVSGGGLGYGFENKGKIRTQSLGVGIFPVDLSLLNQRLEIGLGMEYTFILTDHLTGTSYYWMAGPSSSTIPLDEKKSDFSKTFGFGLLARAAYVFKLENGWELFPQYGFYWGLSNRFSHYVDGVKNMQHLFELGIRKQWRI